MVQNLGLLLGHVDDHFQVRETALAHKAALTRPYRNGGASVFQLTLHKNLNGYSRIMGVPNHASIHVQPRVEIQCV